MSNLEKSLKEEFGNLEGRIAQQFNREPEIEKNEGVLQGKEPLNQWKAETINHPLQPKGGRNLDRYEAVLGFDRHELEGKTVLDLGAGPQVKLYQQLKMSGINAEVVELSPDFIVKKHRRAVRKISRDVEAVAALGQSLPFPDNSFDSVMSLNVLEHLPNDEVYFAFLAEVGRVLKGGGKGVIAPSFEDYYMKDILYDKAINNPTLMAFLFDHGVTLRHEIMSLEIAFYRPANQIGSGRARRAYRLILEKGSALG